MLDICVGKAEFQLALKNDISEIGKVTSKLVQFGEINHVPDEIIYQITLVTDELLTNVISYAFGSPTHAEISVEVKSIENTIHVLIEDNGTPFNPLQEANQPDINLDLDEREIGGLGIHIAKTTMDEISYHRNGNINQMRFQKSFEATNA